MVTVDAEAQEVDEAVERDVDVVKHEADEAVVLPVEAVVETPLLEVPRSTLTTTRPSPAWHKCQLAPANELKEIRIPSIFLRTPREVLQPIYSLLHQYHPCNTSASRSYTPYFPAL